MYNTAMREWNLGPGDPLQLTLAADARLSAPDYVNDHIWELDLGGGDPPALALRTTYGLRARAMRLFPRFIENNNILSDPSAFAVAPRIHRFYPNFLLITFSPIPGIDVTAEYWVPNSQTVMGRMTVVNNSPAPHAIKLEWVGQLIPLTGQSMSTNRRQSVTVLEGRAEGLCPVLFITGGAQTGPGPYPGLMIDLDLKPGVTRQLTWALASLDDHQASFDAARRMVARPFDGERARIELINQSQTVDIVTGDGDWDAALAFSQKAAFSLFFNETERLPNRSFVIARQPDQGFSRRGDGSDYQHLWSGQPALETYYLSALVPGVPDLAKGLLQNFLGTQDSQGAIDSKPGLAGQRSKFTAAPYLASLAWNIFQATGDQRFIKQNFYVLLKFFWAWLDEQHDQDRDGLPEWKHVGQTGFEDNPLFDPWHNWARGVDITTVQSPALSAALYREAQCLIKMAAEIEATGEISRLKAQAEILRNGLAACWYEAGAYYHYTDRDTHITPLARILREQKAMPLIKLNEEFGQPVRLQIRLQTEKQRRPRLTISGELNGAPISESFERTDFAWSESGAAVTTRNVYTKIGLFQFEGYAQKDIFLIQTVDLTAEDITLLTPLWAGVPQIAEAQAMMQRSILNADNFNRPFGLPALPRVIDPQADAICSSVHFPWNHLIGEGLLAYGFRHEAARLTAHMMNAAIFNLKRSRAFYRAYHAENGAGLGDQNALHGFAPVGLFLQTLGVQILSPTRVRLSGENPFPWPVTVKYRGLMITRQSAQTEVVFPNGQSISLNDPTDAVIACDQE
jgi:hypothetical protein